MKWIKTDITDGDSKMMMNQINSCSIPCSECEYCKFTTNIDGDCYYYCIKYEFKLPSWILPSWRCCDKFLSDEMDEKVEKI